MDESLRSGERDRTARSRSRHPVPGVRIGKRLLGRSRKTRRRGASPLSCWLGTGYRNKSLHRERVGSRDRALLLPGQVLRTPGPPGLSAGIRSGSRVASTSTSTCMTARPRCGTRLVCARVHANAGGVDVSASVGMERYGRLWTGNHGWLALAAVLFSVSRRYCSRCRRRPPAPQKMHGS